MLCGLVVQSGIQAFLTFIVHWGKDWFYQHYQYWQMSCFMFESKCVEAIINVIFCVELKGRVLVIDTTMSLLLMQNSNSASTNEAWYNNWLLVYEWVVNLIYMMPMLSLLCLIFWQHSSWMQCFVAATVMRQRCYGWVWSCVQVVSLSKDTVMVICTFN